MKGRISATLRAILRDPNAREELREALVKRSGAVCVDDKLYRVRFGEARDA